MATLTVRSYQGETDLASIAHFLNTCEKADRFGQYYAIDELRREFTEPGFNPTRDMRLWEDDQGNLIAFAQLWIPIETVEPLTDGYLWFRVLPTARGQGLETDIIAWGEVRLWEVGRDRNLPALLRTGCRDDQGDRILLFQNCGFTYERCFLRMGRSLTEPIPEIELPNGFAIATSQGNQDRQLRVELHNAAFADHWNYHPWTLEAATHWEQERYQPELDLIAIAPDGTYAAFCTNDIDPEDNAQRGVREGWVGTLGTHPRFRRRGLARAMLVAGLRALCDRGMELAKLGVDTENPNQAMHLYESVGFQKIHANLSYAKAIER
ncbi:MAG: GNAT family N-acetyltransferase [Oculatellaceae cyanobacterium Prado106]|jgi:mycothiol synthase|nr:GNAT family N-acetyltransferase [Oculatellaceae cyanobacterium Prado106]